RWDRSARGPRTAGVRLVLLERPRVEGSPGVGGREGVGSSAMSTAAVAYCEGVTRTRARNFWYGIRLLPRPKREALAAVYALARRIDDVGDDDVPEAEKRRGLDAVERSLAEIGPGSPAPVLAAPGPAR